MTILRFLGAALMLASSVLLVGPAMAQYEAVHVSYYRSARCAHHQLGNPYTPQEDYMAWSAWRARGGWAEAPYDPACSRGRRHHRAYAR